MKNKENVILNFSFTLHKNEKVFPPEDMINKPIVVNGIPIGVITKVSFNKVSLSYDCNAVFWSKLIKFDVEFDDSLGFSIHSFRVETNSKSK